MLLHLITIIITMSYLVFNQLYHRVTFTIVKKAIGLTRPGANVHLDFNLEDILRGNSIFAGAVLRIFKLYIGNVLQTLQIIKLVQFLKTISYFFWNLNSNK